MREPESGRVTSADRAVYRVAVTVLRPDWVAEWFGEEVYKFVRLEGLKLSGLSLLESVQVLERVAGAMGRAGHLVEWFTERDGFALNAGGVSVRMEEEGKGSDALPY
jgi:hypothetical protein